jgi:hypothetical protein
MEVRLVDIAEVIRSKNAGPYELTFDIIFKEWDMYDKVVASGFFNKAKVAELYDINEEQVINIIEFSPAKAIKATIERPISSGQLTERDVYGAQQHAPLLDLVFEV